MTLFKLVLLMSLATATTSFASSGSQQDYMALESASRSIRCDQAVENFDSFQSWVSAEEKRKENYGTGSLVAFPGGQFRRIHSHAVLADCYAREARSRRSVQVSASTSENVVDADVQRLRAMAGDLYRQDQAASQSRLDQVQSEIESRLNRGRKPTRRQVQDRLHLQEKISQIDQKIAGLDQLPHTALEPLDPLAIVASLDYNGDCQAGELAAQLRHAHSACAKSEKKAIREKKRSAEKDGNVTCDVSTKSGTALNSDTPNTEKVYTLKIQSRRFFAGQAVEYKLGDGRKVDITQISRKGEPISVNHQQCRAWARLAESSPRVFNLAPLPEAINSLSENDRAVVNSLTNDQRELCDRFYPHASFAKVKESSENTSGASRLCAIRDAWSEQSIASYESSSLNPTAVAVPVAIDPLPQQPLRMMVRPLPPSDGVF